MPAKNAPSANDTPKSLAEPNATPRASAMTARVNSSREPVSSTRLRSQGKTRTPTTSIRTANSAILPSVRPSVIQRLPGAGLPSSACPPRGTARAGRSTRARTITRSSTISQPIAMRPSPDSSRPRASSARSSTTVLATDSASPNTSPAPSDQPHAIATPMASAVARTICARAPGSATARTARRSRNEKCIPTPNMSRMTPISASCGASS